MYDTILVPTDGTERATPVIEEAVDLAATTGAAIHGLHVVDTRDYGTLPDNELLNVQDRLDDQGEQALQAVTDAAAAADVSVTTELRRGSPHEEIVAAASEAGADLIVVGTHGRTGVNRFLLGSVTEKVVRSAPIPVHVVNVADDT